MRISVQLVKADDRIQLWSETYDRSLEDIFAVQDDIAQSVVKELRTTLLGEAPDSDASGAAQADVAAAAKGHGTNPEAHRLYLEGKYFIDRLNEEDNIRGMRLLEEAVRLDPRHALAWTELARAYNSAGGYGWGPLHESYAKARECVDRALAITPDLPEAYLRLSGTHRLYTWDWRAAEATVQRAMELAPGNPEVIRSAGGLAMNFGRLDEAERLTLRAVEQDPLNPAGYLTLANLHRFAGRYAEAERMYRKSLDLAPRRIGLHFYLAFILALQERHAEALETAQREISSWSRLTSLASVHFLAGRRAEADETLAELSATHGHDCAYQIAAIHALRGETESVFQWLERGIETRDAGMQLVATEPVFRPYHADPRWKTILNRMGLD